MCKFREANKTENENRKQKNQSEGNNNNAEDVISNQASLRQFCTVQFALILDLVTEGVRRPDRIELVKQML